MLEEYSQAVSLMRECVTDWHRLDERIECEPGDPNGP
jgi:hypothetical protein